MKKGKKITAFLLAAVLTAGLFAAGGAATTAAGAETDGAQTGSAAALRVSGQFRITPDELSYMAQRLSGLAQEYRNILQMEKYYGKDSRTTEKKKSIKNEIRQLRDTMRGAGLDDEAEQLYGLENSSEEVYVKGISELSTDLRALADAYAQAEGSIIDDMFGGSGQFDDGNGGSVDWRANGDDFSLDFGGSGKKIIDNFKNLVDDTLRRLTGTLRIGKGITSIGPGAFSGFGKLKNIIYGFDYLPSEIHEEMRGVRSADDDSAQEEAYEGILSIGAFAFMGCTSLEEIVIPKSVTELGLGAFAGCSAAKEVAIEDGASGFEAAVFANCASLKKLTVPGSVTEITEAFAAGCGSLETVELKDGVTTIAKNAFADTPALTDLTIPESVTSIDDKIWSGGDTSQLVIHGVPGSAAEQYADKNGFAFMDPDGKIKIRKSISSAVKKTQQISVAKKTYKKVYGSKAFSLKASAKTALTFKSDNKKAAVVTSAGKVKIKGVGTAKITIRAKETAEYQAAKPVTVKITVVPKATKITGLSAGKGAITVKWKKLTKQTTGYQIQYAKNKKFTKGKKLITVTKNKTTSKKIKKLKSNKKYYVRVRTYKKVKGKKYCSAWSKAKPVTVK